MPLKQDASAWQKIAEFDDRQRNAAAKRQDLIEEDERLEAQLDNEARLMQD